MSDVAYKALLMLIWPLLLVLLCAFFVIAFAAAWFAIPFGRVVRKDGGGYSIKFGDE